MGKKILVTGANGYIATHLIPQLIEAGHQVFAVVRKNNCVIKGATMIVADLTKEADFEKLPCKIDAAFYFLHALREKQFIEIDRIVAKRFVNYLNQNEVKQCIYLTGLISDQHLSAHLSSRLEVETILKEAKCAHTVLRAGIVIGDGSASFEIMRDLVEKLPLMIAPKWVKQKCQPIAISDVIHYLIGVINHEACYNQTFDIGGPEQLTYKEMLLQLAKVRQLKRALITVPVLTPHLSSWWLYLVTSTHFQVARNLVHSLKNNAICSEHSIQKILPFKCLTYIDALKAIFATSKKVPKFGCFISEHTSPFKEPEDEMFQKVLQIGGKNGYPLHFLWVVRGAIDKWLKGPGLSGERNLKEGGVIDFWRITTLDYVKKQLVLRAEMKLPGEAWLVMSIENHHLTARAVFRPKGVGGRLYWWLTSPFHWLIFKRLSKYK